METIKYIPLKTDELLKQAEEILCQPSASTPGIPYTDVRDLVDRLLVYQSELEVKNNEMQNAQRLLEELHSKYYSLYDLAPIGYFTFDQDGIILDVNLTGAKMLGVPRKELISKPFTNFIFSEFQVIFYLFRKKVIETGTSNTCELKLDKKNGGEFFVQLESRVIQDDRKSYKWIQVAMMDISRRKKLENALLTSEAQKNAILNGITTSLAFVNDNMEMLWANRTAADSINKTPGEMIGKKCYECWADSEKPCDGCPTLKAFKTKKTEQAIICFPDGKVWDEKSEPVFNDKGDLIGVLEIAHDITEKIRLEAQLRHASKMEAIGTLAGGIAHDFNNILGSIVINAEMAFEDAVGNQDVKYSIDQILKSSLRAKELVRQILTFSRDTETQRAPVNIGSIVKETLRMLRSVIPTTVTIETDIPEDTGNILADSTQIQQLVMNLCSNAAHAMNDKGGVLEIDISEVKLDEAALDFNLSPGHYIEMLIKDSGSGIPTEHRQLIFDPFFTTKQPGEGTGLGLSVVMGIIMSHGGSINVDSEVGRGTTFQVLFPIEDVAVILLKEDSSCAPRGSERILFVDDEEALVDAGKRMLERLGYKVTTATSGAEAFDLFSEQSGMYDLVITDMTMPNITGEQLSRQLLNVRPDIPIILCTGYNNLINPEKAMNIGIRDYLMKPFDRKEMAEIIRKALDGDED